MQSLRFPWRLLSILCVLALVFPAIPISALNPSLAETVAYLPLAVPDEQTASQDEPSGEPAADAGQVPDEIAAVPGATSDWWAAVQEQIRQDMYSLFSEERQDGILSYRGHNLAHSLDLTFAGGGLRLAPAPSSPDAEGEPEPAQAAEDPLWTLDLRLSGYGYEGDVQPVPAPAETTAAGGRLEYQREGITEWYVNDTDGLEQGFVLSSPPASRAAGSLVLEMALDGGLLPTLTADGQTIDFVLPESTVILLRYSELYVTDAAGQQLPAHFSLPSGGESRATAGSIRIAIDDAGATYPLTVDPLFSTPPWTALGENHGDWFGYAAGTAGDVNGDGYDEVIVGATGGAASLGHAYVYYGSSSGLSLLSWSRSGYEAASYYGDAVGTAGDVNGDGYDDIVIGAPGAPGSGILSCAYIHHGSASGLSQQASKTVCGEAPDQGYASELGTAGDVNSDGYDDLIVGAQSYTLGENTRCGKAYVYHGSMTGLSTDPAWTDTGGEEDARLGGAVAMAGDVNGDGYHDVVVSAEGARNFAGTVSVYFGARTGLSRSPDWTATGENAHDYFGISTGTAGDINGDGYADIVVSAVGYDDGTGRVYIYHGSALGLGASTRESLFGKEAGNHFGCDVGTAGDVNGDGYDDLLVGACPGDESDRRLGTVHLYLGSETDFAANLAWTATGEQPHDGFGTSVGAAGDVNGDGYDDFILGARQYTADGVNYTGKVYVYSGSEINLSGNPAWTATGANADDGLGWSTATAGDVNGDGFSDIVVGAPHLDVGVAGTGQAYVFHGAASGLSQAPDWAASGENPGDSFGWSAATAGDVNGDGYDDLVASAPGHGGKGKVYLYLGSASGLGPDPAWTADGEHAGDGFGYAVAPAGDVNGDGNDDVLASAFGYPVGNGQGKAYLYLGKQATEGGDPGLSVDPAWTAGGESPGDSFGASLGTAGDVNADGFADIVVGAPYHEDGGDAGAGKVYVYHGSAGGTEETAAMTATGSSAGHWFGYAVGTAGDVNGDGYADVAIGAPGVASQEGRAYVYYGSVNGLDGTHWTLYIDLHPYARLGSAVGTAGDVNGDGYADLVVGADGHHHKAGRVFVYHGGPDGLPTRWHDWTAFGEQTGDHFGHVVATAGDVNGDGYADLLAGAWGYNELHAANVGKVYLYQGGAQGPSAQSDVTLNGENPGDVFGAYLATAGDLNGDGFADIVVSAPNFDSERGKVYVYYGGLAGLTAGPADWSAEGEHTGDHYGGAVGTAGDVNGDGYADLVVSAQSCPAPDYLGRVYVYHGGPTGLRQGTADWIQDGQDTFDQFGWSVGTAGDVNGDGYADLLVGAPGAAANDSGMAYAFLGSATGLETTAAWSGTGENTYDSYGWSVGTAGDVNGDGYPEVIIGSVGYPDQGGKVYLYQGGSVTEGGNLGISTDPVWTASGKPGDWFGTSVGTAGDVNGDGYADLVVGAPRYDSQTGRVYLYHGSAVGLDSPFAQLTGEATSSYFGESVGTAGDVNGDGYADLIVGAYAYNGGQGKAYVYHGSAAGLNELPVWTVVGENSRDYYGCTVATAGDVNGDGYADLLAGAFAYDGDKGRAYLYQGNDGDGREVLARSFRGDGSGIAVQPWGVSHTPHNFQVSMRVTHPLGRGRAKLQVQACPPGVPFDDAACRDHTPAGWHTISGETGAVLTESVAGLERFTLYRWRARAVYDSPLAGRGPWRRFLGQALEADVRSMELPTDLVITKSVSPDPPVAGETMFYELTFRADSGPAKGVVIYDTIPSHISNVIVASTGAAITDITGPEDQPFIWSVQDLDVGEGGTITIKGVADEARLINTAVISSTTPEIDPSNNRATVQTRVPGIIFVDADAPGPAHDGFTWASAYTSLQDALGAPGVPGAAGPGDEIWVAEGVYKPTAGADRTATFQLVDGVQLYGGFTGDEVYRHERDWAENPTVLSGDIGTENNPADNVFHVVTGGGVTAAAVLDGFTVIGGNADGSGADGMGGGLYNDTGSPTLFNVTFAGNAAGQGGGIYNASGGSPALIDVAFTGNTAAGDGGGLFNSGGSNPQLTNVTFSGNSAAGAGGAIGNQDSNPVLRNCILWGNVPDQISDAGTSTTNVDFCDVQGGWPGAANIDADPAFYDADGPDDILGTLDDNLRLRHTSAAIDVGDDSVVPTDVFDLDGDGDTDEPLPLDLSARSRRIGYTSLTPHVDMGAYEANILDVIAEAGALLEQGTRFRLEDLELLSADTLAEALQNYKDFKDGEHYYDFCDDYDQIDASGYCPDNPERKNVRNKLMDAVGLYLVVLGWPTEDWMTHDGQVIHVRETGGSGAVAAAHEMARVHLIFGNEFLIDAIDYRFSIEGIPYADEIIAKELDELAHALLHFELTMDLVFRAFDKDDWNVGWYFTTKDFETFGVASGRMIMTLDEMAARYRMGGDDETALAVYDQAYEEQNLSLTALAEMAEVIGEEWLINGSWEMLNNLSMMRARAQAIRDGLDFFGFAADYVPLQAYADLLALTEGPTGEAGLLGAARDLGDQARDAQRTFDGNAAEMEAELDRLILSYEKQLFEICGPSEDADGDGLDDYDPCGGGLMARNFHELDAASLRAGRAYLHAQNFVDKLQAERERAEQIITVQFDTGYTIEAAELAIGKLRAYRESTTTITETERQIGISSKLYSELFAEVEAVVSTIPHESGVSEKSGLKLALEFAEFEWELHKKELWSTETLFEPEELEIGHYESIKALQQAEAEATITRANSEAAVRNLLLQQSEALREYEVAVAEFNKLAAEQNFLAQKHGRLLSLRANAANRIARWNSHLLSPAYRVMRDSLTVQSAEAHALAAQFAYLTAKAAEYELLTPYPALNKIYGARTANDIRLFLDGLKVWYQASDRPGQLNRYPYVISIAKDIAGLTDENLDPKGKLPPWRVDVLRRKAFQKYLQAHLYEDRLELQFTTTLEQRRPNDQYLFSPNIWNNRIAGIGAPLGQNEGISINIVTRQDDGFGRPEIVLIHDGQSSYRTAAGETLDLDPDTAVPVGYLLPPELDPESTAIVLRPSINGEGAVANSGLINQSVATSAWTLRLPYDSQGNLELNRIEDIEIHMDTTGRALPGRSPQAERDAQRLQSGLEMEPVTDAPAPRLALSWLRQPDPGPSRSLMPANPEGIGGSYFGKVVVTSPVTVALHVLNFDLVNTDGTLSGALNVAEAPLYHGDVAVQGSTDGERFAVTSGVIHTTVLGRPVQRQFSLEGTVLENGDLLKATYSSVISGLLPDPIVEQGRFSASRPKAAGSQRLLLQSAAALVPLGSSTPITVTLNDRVMRLIQTPQQIAFGADLGTVSPAEAGTTGGVALATFTAGDTPGWATIVATTGEVTGTLRIEIEGGASPITGGDIYLPLVTYGHSPP